LRFATTALGPNRALHLVRSGDEVIGAVVALGGPWM
jgi:hypothetical protein